MSDFFAHARALVETDDVGPGTNIWAFAHIMNGAHIGAHCNLGDHVFVESGARIGDRVTLKNNVCVWEGVTIEDDVFVGPGVMFTNDMYPRSPRMPAAADRYQDKANWLQPTRVRRGASIGARATVMPGVDIGEYATVAAGGLVTKPVDSFALMVGAPARRVGWVCRCGMRLPGDYRETTCRHCGETSAERLENLSILERK